MQTPRRKAQGKFKPRGDSANHCTAAPSLKIKLILPKKTKMQPATGKMWEPVLHQVKADDVADSRGGMLFCFDGATLVQDVFFWLFSALV